MSHHPISYASPNKFWLTLLGWFCVVLAIIGAVLPVMPTTVFLISAAWCFSRSNQKYYQWLLNHRVFGECVRGWQEGKPIPRRAYQKILMLLWLSLCVSSLLTSELWIDILLLVVGLSVSLYLWFKSDYHQ